MSGPELRSLRFRLEREADWRALETLLRKVEAGRVGALSEEDLLALPILYNSAISALSAARATSLDASLVAYLEGLATRAYFLVYGSHARLGERIVRFFRVDWPAAVRNLWRETAISGAIFVLGALAAYVLVSRDADWFGVVMSGDQAQGRDPTASTAFLKSALHDTHGFKGLSYFATFLFTHNAQVAILAFALGFAFCLPTALLIGQNGLGLGALMAVYGSRGLGLSLGAWLMIHGVTELLATILAGAAGFRIGWSVMFPGPLSRLEAARRAGQTAGTAMAGVVVMLMIAGLLEGVGRQVIQDDAARWTVAAVSLVLWLLYFSRGGRPRTR